MKLPGLSSFHDQGLLVCQASLNIWLDRVNESKILLQCTCFTVVVHLTMCYTMVDYSGSEFCQVISFIHLQVMRGMTMQLESVCGRYQEKREVRGRASCSNHRHRCVYGPHRCGRCGDEGHGWYECDGRLPNLKDLPYWEYKPRVSHIPPVPPPPIRARTMPAPAAPGDGTPRSKSNPGSPRTHTPASGFAQPPPAVHVSVASGFAQPPLSWLASGFDQPPQPPPASQASGIIQASGCAQPPQPSPTSQATGVIQSSAAVPMKGHGKGAVFGIQLPLPMPLSSPQSASAHVGLLPQVVPLTLAAEGVTPLPVGCPPPKQPDEAYCQKWFEDYFTVMDTPQRWPPHAGDEVLWKGVKIKPSGNESGKQEYFNGHVHAVEETSEGTFLTVC